MRVLHSVRVIVPRCDCTVNVSSYFGVCDGDVCLASAAVVPVRICFARVCSLVSEFLLSVAVFIGLSG